MLISELSRKNLFWRIWRIFGKISFNYIKHSCLLKLSDSLNETKRSFKSIVRGSIFVDLILIILLLLLKRT